MIFLTKETERQMLPFSKWLTGKKNKNDEKRKNQLDVHTRHRTPDLSLGKQAFHTVLHTILHSNIIRYSRLKCPQTPFFPSSVAHSHFYLKTEVNC